MFGLPARIKKQLDRKWAGLRKSAPWQEEGILVSPWEWEAGHQSVKRKADRSLCPVFLWLPVSQQILLFFWGGNTHSTGTRMDACALPLPNRQTPRGWERTRAEGLNHSLEMFYRYFSQRQNPSQKQLKGGEWVYFGPKFESHVGEGRGSWRVSSWSIVHRQEAEK